MLKKEKKEIDLCEKMDVSILRLFRFVYLLINFMIIIRPNQGGWYFNTRSRKVVYAIRKFKRQNHQKVFTVKIQILVLKKNTIQKIREI